MACMQLAPGSSPRPLMTKVSAVCAWLRDVDMLIMCVAGLPDVVRPRLLNAADVDAPAETDVDAPADVDAPSETTFPAEAAAQVGRGSREAGGHWSDGCKMVSAGFAHSVVLSCSGRLFSFGSNENGELGVRAEVVASDIPLEVEFDWGSLVSRGGVGEVELEKG